MAKTINDIKQELGISDSSTIDDLLTLASQYKVFSSAEINNIKAISVLPLPTNVKDRAEELKQRFTDIVLNENKGQLHSINVRTVIILEILEKLIVFSQTALTASSIADDLTTNDSSKVLSAKQGKVLKAMLDTLEAATYTKTETNALLDTKADKSTTYTKNQVDSALATKADRDATDSRFLLVESAIDDLISVQNVVDIVPTYSALQSYDTTKLNVNDKVQVIADETHDGASTIYNWNGSAWQYVGAYGTNSYTKAQTYTKTETLEQIDIHKLINKTYSELATLKANNGLVAGQMYRITDYVTTTNGICNGHNDDVRSVEHPFDLIVTAISNNEFSENARAIQHTGDSYFANSKLEAWRLWYCFENDTNRFEWADTTNGKGVIYRMIDEFQNDVPYDFKNIQFKRYVITGVTDSRQSTLIGEYLGFYENYNVTSDSTDYVWNFTFEKRSDGTDLSLVEVNNSTFNQNSYVKQVVIGEYITDNPTYRCKQALNNIVMVVDALIVDVSMGKGSHHNTWFGNEDIDYCYFASMFRQNILYGEINHTRADECFEKNVIGDGALTTYASCWNKFTHHFSRNIGINMQSNDFEGQVDETKFPLHFTRNHISNMWDEVNASSHTTFNRCEFGYMVDVTLSGAGDWDSVKTIMCYNVTIKIANLYGSVFNRMEYVILSQNNSVFNIANLTVGSIYGSSSKILNIALGNLVNRDSVYEKRIDWAYNTGTENKSLIYTFASYDATNYIMDNYSQIGTIGDDGTVTWDTVTKFFTKIDNIKMNKTNPTGTGTISMNSGTASNYGYANGSGANASGMFSKAVGFGAQASGSYSIAIIGNASGSGAVAIGNMANASGDTSKALGEGAKAKGDNQTVIGKFNISDTSSLEIVGCGAYMNEDNARLLDANGNEYLKGDLFIDTTFTKDANKDLVSKNGTSLKQALLNINENLYNESTENGNANTITLSNPQDCGEMVKLGGMSYKSDNLLVMTDEVKTVSSVQFTISNGTISSSGTPSSTGWIKIKEFTLNAGTYSYADLTTNTSKVYLVTSNFVQLATTFTLSETTTVFIGKTGNDIINNGNVSNSMPMIVSGSTAPTTWSKGFSGIRDSAVTQITLKDSNNETKSTISIPSAIQNLDGYGWGIDDTCYNYIDFATKKFVQKVGCVVLNGTESGWEDRPNYTYADRFVLNESGFLSPSEKGIVNWAGFEYIVTAPTTYPYVSNYNGHIMVNFSAKGTTTLAQFKEYLGTNNLIVYYELAAPIETDISVYYVNDMLSTSLANNDVVEFVNTYNQKVPFSIKYYNKYQLRDISTLVDKDGNPRFIEGNGIGLSQTGVTITQCKWSLSGTHLMVVCAGTIEDEVTIGNGDYLATYDVPSYIFNKVNPVWLTNIEAKSIDMYAQDWSKQTAFIRFTKGVSKLTITNGSALTLTATRNFKVQFDLLIDTD